MPNDQTPTNVWGKWRVTVEDVEELTGFTFFDKVPEVVRKSLRKQLDEEQIPGEIVRFGSPWRFTMCDPAVMKLATATEGLVFVSERDAPFEAFSWEETGALTPRLVCKLGGHDETEPVTQTECRPFFDALTEEQDWHGDEEKEQTRKYRELRVVFESEVTNRAIFRVGTIDVTYYIVGRSPAGSWIGVKTQATET